MGLRFRKSMKIAPGVKLNLNKKSAGITLGGKGINYTVNTKGTRTSSIGIPGSGAYYTDVKHSKKTKATSNTNSKHSTAYQETNAQTTDITKKQSKRGCLTSVFISLAVLVTLIFLASSNANTIQLDTITINTDYNTTELDINEVINIDIDFLPNDVEIEDIKFNYDGTYISVELNDNYDTLSITSLDREGISELSITVDEIVSNTVTLVVSDYDRIESDRIAEEERLAEEKRIAEEKAVQEKEEYVQMVWIPSSGSKYHSKSSCSSMNSPSEVTIDRAKGLGFTACGRCY